MVNNMRHLPWTGALVIALLVGVLAAACGGQATPEPTQTVPGSTATPTPQLPGPDEDPTPSPTGPKVTMVLAPVESIEIERIAAKPPNATMIVVSGLPSGCDSFEGYSLTREDDTFILEVRNLKPELDCPATYTTVTTSILLGQPVYGDIEPCKTYIVVVNGETRSVESSCPIIDSGQFPEATPTPGPIREWDLQDIRVNGSTVTVPLHVYAGIDVRATLDGKEPDEINAPVPILEFVFKDVPPGKHTVEVRDVVGFNKTVEVVVATTGTPDWLAELIIKLENEPVANPPLSITQYGYKGQTVYFVPQRCCDIFSDLYDADGNLIAHPDGGITGQGDGRATDFFNDRIGGRTIWKDRRVYDHGQVLSPAPIENVEIMILESFPVQYRVLVVSGLPNACYSFAGYRLERNGDTIRIEMTNSKPAEPRLACAQVYGIVETTIPLGKEFQSGSTYTIDVNDATETFVAQ